MDEKLKIAVYDKIDDNIDTLFLSEEHTYTSVKATQNAFDNWYSDDVVYDFDRWYGENYWSVDLPDDDTQVLYVRNVPTTVVKLVHIYSTHTSE